jgi:hypothetical protein
LIVVDAALAPFVVPLVMLLALALVLGPTLRNHLKQRPSSQPRPLQHFELTDWNALYLDGRWVREKKAGRYTIEQPIAARRKAKRATRRVAVAHLAYRANLIGPFVRSASITFDRAQDRMELVLSSYVFWPWQLIAPTSDVAINYNGKLMGKLVITDRTISLEDLDGRQIGWWHTGCRLGAWADHAAAQPGAKPHLGLFELGDLKGFMRVVRVRPDNNRIVAPGEKLAVLEKLPTADEEPWLMALFAYAAYAETALAAQLSRRVYLNDQ